MSTDNGYSIEELTQELIQLKDELAQSKLQNENLTNQLSEKDSMINSLNSNVSELKQKNYDLFIKVSQPQIVSHETQEKQDVIHLDDLINNIL